MVNMKLKFIIVFILCGPVFIAGIRADEKKTTTPSRKGASAAMGEEVVSRQNLEKQAAYYVKRANKYYQDNLCELAIENYLNAKAALEKCDPDGVSDYVKRKIDSCDQQIANCYYIWSKTIANEAEELARSQDYDEAIAKCQQAMKIYPQSQKKMKDLIKQYSKMKKVVTYRREISEDTVDPNKENRLYGIAVLLKQGSALYNDGQYDKARDKFEEVLIKDPFNFKAINWLRRVNLKLKIKGHNRANATFTERIAEEQWKTLTPIVPRTLTGTTESILTPVDRESPTDKIQKKLKDIIIDRIEFEEVTIPTVVKFLKQRSKQLDPENIGINIFLRLSYGPAPESTGKKKPAATAAPAAPGAPSAAAAKPKPAGGDGGGLFDDEGGGDDLFGGGGGGGGAAGGGGGTSTTATIPTVTMVVDDISLDEAIRYICRAANLKYRVEKYAVVIASQDIPLDEVETRIYPLEQEALEAIGGGEDVDAVMEHFRSRGVGFPTGAKIVYDSNISRLVATNTPENLKKIEEIIHNELNAVDPQVLIQAKFIEVTQNDLEELSFNYVLSRTSSGSTGSASSVLWGANDELNRTGSTLATVPGGSTIVDWSRTYSGGQNLRVIVNMLDQCDTSDVLSTPRVTTMNGQQATIRMVTEYYYPEEWSEATISNDGVFVSSIPQFGDVTEEGIILLVTPNVDADRYTITLDMNPVVQSRVDWNDYSYQVYIGDSTNSVMRTNIIKMPVIEARTVETTVTIYDGETIVLGGIIKDATATINDQYPVLGDIPVIGRLFQSKAISSEKVNLLIFLTCRLVNPDGSPIRERELRGLPAFRQ